MAGSQLKQLKEKLKSAGLTGQTNVKKKGKAKRAPNETRRQDRDAVLKGIREQFNIFDVSVNRNKRADATAKKVAVGRPGVAHKNSEAERRIAYDAKRQSKNRAGGIRDRRFGESDQNMTTEEKMLERFTRERQAQASKASIFNLDDDENDSGFDTLTHNGQSLGFGSEDEIEDDDEDFLTAKRGPSSFEEIEEEPKRKRTKAEVMQEVIAKSKFYRHERQKENERTENAIMELDEDFQDVMSEVRSVKQPRSNGIVAKSQADIEYDQKVRELALDRKAVPAERTKTQEELEREKKEHLAKLEAARLRRMEGYVEDENKEKDADDLDDNFWDGSDNEEDGFTIKYSDEEDNADADVEKEDDEEEEFVGRNRLLREQSGKQNTITINGKVFPVTSTRVNTSLPCPSTLDDFINTIEGNEYPQVIVIINKIFAQYKHNLAEGNKERCGVFATVLLQYTLKLADEEYEDEQRENYIELIEYLSKINRELAERYPEKMYLEFKKHIEEIHSRVVSRSMERNQSSLLKKSDLIFFTLIGRTFSTSDLYHLIVTPSVILICEILEILQIEKYQSHLFSGIYLVDLLLQYQRISKRMIPETIHFMERAILAIMQDPENFKDIDQLSTRYTKLKKTKFTMKLGSALPESVVNLSFKTFSSDLDDTLLGAYLLKVIQSFSEYSSNIFKEKLSFLEITAPFTALLKHLIKYHASSPQLVSTFTKLTNLTKIAKQERAPLRLQTHRAVAIPTYVPKFHDNFNPDKKSYDPDVTRHEINKLKHELKEERKSQMREIRKDSRFEAGEQIKEKKKEYQEYHAKMAKIYNSIQTEEGAAKNEYERERKQRKDAKK